MISEEQLDGSSRVTSQLDISVQSQTIRDSVKIIQECQNDENDPDFVESNLIFEEQKVEPSLKN